MLEIGRFNHLEVKKISPFGAYLASESGEILLPQKYAPDGLKAGDAIQVFVYLDSDGRLTATTRTPKAQVGEFAVLEVKDNGPNGAFLDWGPEKDLFVPFSEQTVPMRKREKYLVRVYLDKSGRIAASARIGRFLESGVIPLQVGEVVDLTIWELTDLGAKVVINGRYAGLLFKNELYGKPAPGTRLKGCVSKVRDDKKIDVTMRKGGHSGIGGDKERIVAALEESGGYLPLGDKSSPSLIGEVLQMSKKSFKKAIGGLYKDGLIELAEEGIRLRNKFNVTD